MKRKAIFLLYRVLQALLSPVILTYLLVRVLRDRRYLRTIPERLGVLPALWQKTAPGAIWLHAVSVGEVLAAAPLIEELHERLPRVPLYVSTSTVAGRDTAALRLRHVEGVFYAPLDFVWAVRRVLRRLKPSLVIVVETEIWPNLFREANRIGCGLAIVNGRISDRTAARYKRFAGTFGLVLRLCDRVLVQSAAMRDRFIAAGAPEKRVSVTGNLKYDLRPVEVASPFDSTRPVWVAASTSADTRIEEEDFVVAAQQRLPGWRLILAPRRPERFERVAEKLRAAGLRWARRTQPREADYDVLLLDTVGELSGLFAHADVVFMGGTLAEKGGHNILEPAIFGKPIVAGPHLENFREIETEFESRGALIRIQHGEDLADAIVRAASDTKAGVRAREAALMHTGARGRIADVLVELHASKYPCYRAAQPEWMFLWPLAQMWRFFSARDRRRKQARQRRLAVPVVSIGNITAGGTGKTPVTIELLRAFGSRSPGLLTRGHGRSTTDVVILPTGKEEVPVTATGDEAQLYRQQAPVPMGIGSDRYEAGEELLRAASPRILLLDDGFQHLQLYRNFDLVVVDALQPFGGGHLIPLGRLREPLEGLARADAFLITRSDQACNPRAIAATLRRYNAGAAIFYARTIPGRWVGTGEGAFNPGDPCVAFCGLGNPQSFWNTLAGLGIEPKACLSYGDHHHYSPAEVRRLLEHALDLQAEILLTTAKDAVNMSDDVRAMIEPMRLYWLEIEMEIERRDDLIAAIARAIDGDPEKI